MKFFSQLRNRMRKSLTANERGQGATEYILLLVVLVGLVMAFKKPIKAQFDKAMGKVESDMGTIIEE